MSGATTCRLCLAAWLTLGTAAVQAQTVLRARLPSPPAEQTSRYDRVFRVVAWPGYGIAMRDPSPLGRMQKMTLANERIGFLLDAATTWGALRSNNFENNGMNTLFGDTSQAGVIGSMTAWELGASYVSAAAPRRIRNGRLRTVVRLSVVVGGSLLTRDRFRVSLSNIRNMRDGN